MQVNKHPCNELVGFDKKHNVIMAESYWSPTHTFNTEGEWEITESKKATNPPEMYFITEEVKIAHFHHVQENPSIIPIHLLPEGVMGATIEVELLGTCDL